MTEKIDGDMTMTEMITIMGEGNLGAVSAIVEILQDTYGLYDVLSLDSMDIRGSRLYMFYSVCCQRDPAKFKRTLVMLRMGVFTLEQIHENLGRGYALPFIDDSIEMDGVPPYGEYFGPGCPRWDEWCEAQKESFRRRTS